MPKKAFVFPGQASQYIGMGADFYEKGKIARSYFDAAESQLGFALKEFSFNGPLNKLTQTAITQPAIFTFSLIVYEELKQRGFQPEMVAGHSLGEYSALVAAGSLPFEEGLNLVKIRSEQMQIATEKTVGTMAAIVGLSIDKVREIISDSSVTGICNVANVNSPSQIVISGETHSIQMMMREMKNAGAKMVVELTVGGAFHSELMTGARIELKKALDAAIFKPPSYPIYLNVTAKASVDPIEIRQRLIEQLTSPVLWSDSIHAMINDGADTFVEVGPGKVLQGLIKRTSGDVNIFGISTWHELTRFQWS
ncbi:MAG: [acyl-carrier-protein] S-malonyltransferase [Candidatus Marinimicrobia bacterium CG08_land_8_20_14_0_20_45_22]|nr:MAG: [acyl-carrier-protein] S-malonyltransferase [Candidatus Marinimicrobia bacterium CG08_land_8_20_14_0_20_45_22]